MPDVALPTRTGPLTGTFAFDEAGELQIYEAVMIHGMKKIKVAALCDTSIVTVDAIIKRVEARPASEPSGQADVAEQEAA